MASRSLMPGPGWPLRWRNWRRGRIAVVGHNVTNRGYLAALMGIPIDRAQGNPAGEWWNQYYQI